MYKLTIFLFLSVINAAKLPSYMIPCSRSDPNLNECIVKHSNLAVPVIVKGDKQYKIPNLLPLEVTEVVTEPGPNLKIVMSDLKVHGMDNLRVLKANLDFDKNILTLQSTIPVLTILSDYEMKGQILILPVQGKGRSNVTIVGGIYDYNLHFDFKKSKKDGEVYTRIINFDLDFHPKRTIYDFENLFNGDKRLGAQLNNFLNENWKEVHDDLKGGVGITMGTVMTSILNSIFKTVPYKDMFLP